MISETHFWRSITKVRACVPFYKNKQELSKPKWTNRRLQTLIRKKQEAWQKYRTRKSETHRERYIKARNLVTRVIISAKYSYERQVALDSVNNQKHFWAYVCSMTSAKGTITRLKTTSGEMTQNETNCPNNE